MPRTRQADSPSPPPLCPPTCLLPPPFPCPSLTPPTHPCSPAIAPTLQSTPPLNNHNHHPSTTAFAMAAQSLPSTSQQQPTAAAAAARPIVPLLQTNTTQQPARKDSFPPNTPSALSHVSSPGAPAPSPSVKRPIAPATEAPGAPRPPGPERKPTSDGRSQSIVDPATGKKKRISLSCAQCESTSWMPRMDGSAPGSRVYRC